MRLAALFLATVTITSMNEVAAQQFSEGQVWKYRARLEEATSTLLINKVEVKAKLGEVYHISVRSVQVKNRHAPNGVSTKLPHFPVSRKTLELSVTTLVGTSPVNPDYREKYATWRKAYEEGNAGIFTIPVAKIVGFVESTLSQ
jgi:hypothetical protein